MTLLKYGLASIWLIIVLLYWSPSQAQGVCGKSEEISDELRSKYNEIKRISLLTNKGTMLEIFVSLDEESWSLVLTSPAGNSCLIDAGKQAFIEDMKGPAY